MVFHRPMRQAMTRNASWHRGNTAMIRTRFAPSPNGPLHLGHAFAAITAHDIARGEDGEFTLRIEDIDGARSRPEFVEAILTDLNWLGLTWDRPPAYQSARLTTYDDAANNLHDLGLLYPCRCTRAEIAAAADRMGPDGPIYPGTCRGKDVDPDGAAWRIDTARALQRTGPLQWHDAVAGVQTALPDRLGDVILVRKDDPASYHLAVTLDDAADAITVVTRGTDLFESTHIHRLLQALLDLPIPIWHHHPLLVEADGRKLAKRRGSPSLGDRRRAGDDGLALAHALRIGQLPTGISLSEG